MDNYESIQEPVDKQSHTNMKVFTGWVLLAQILGLSSVILVAVWMGHYHDGFAWTSDPDKQFNYHPLFMIIGMVFLYGDAILVYRVFRNDKKMYIKLLHACLHVFALIFAGVGLKAVFDSHNHHKPDALPNLYSLHSWVGLATIILFALQWLVGLTTFLLPGLRMDVRLFYKPMHIYWGIAIFLMATATCLMGITEKELFTNLKGYTERNDEGTVANVLGIVLVALALTVCYIVSNPNYKRQPLPEEEQIQLTQ